MRWVFITAIAMSLFAPAARAVMPGEVLPDAALEARARNLSAELRCLVCQNQSIDDSAAPLARDLRMLVRERLVLGDTDEQVLSYLVARYGNYVLLKPPLQSDTLVLWIGPGLILALAGAVFAAYVRRSGRLADEPVAPLTDAERRQLAAHGGDD